MAERKRDYVVNPSIEPVFEIRYRTRLGEPQVMAVNPADAGLEKLLSILAQAANADQPLAVEDLDVEVDDATLEFLSVLGIVIKASEVPPVAHACPSLETVVGRCELALRYDTASAPSDGELALNPRVWTLDHEDCPIEAQAYASPNPLLQPGPGALIAEDPENLVLNPVQLSGRLLDAWSRLCAGTTNVEALSADISSPLACARLLVPKGVASKNFVEGATRQLAARGYAVLRNVTSPYMSEALRSYARDLTIGGYLNRGDSQVANRWYRHDDPVMRATHYSIAKLIEEITSGAGTPCRPSYSYYATYDRGAALERHVDRPQCRWNVSLCLGSDPFLPRNEQWPIHLEIDGRDEEVRLGSSDAILYAGSEVEHWREPLTEAERYYVCFFHFVEHGFRGPLD